MNIKLIAIIGAIILILAVAGGIYTVFNRTTETYKAKEQIYHTFEPHFIFGGCAHYQIPKK